MTQKSFKLGKRTYYYEVISAAEIKQECESNNQAILKELQQKKAELREKANKITYPFGVENSATRAIKALKNAVENPKALEELAFKELAKDKNLAIENAALELPTAELFSIPSLNNTINKLHEKYGKKIGSKQLFIDDKNKRKTIFEIIAETKNQILIKNAATYLLDHQELLDDISNKAVKKTFTSHFKTIEKEYKSKKDCYDKLRSEQKKLYQSMYPEIYKEEPWEEPWWHFRFSSLFSKKSPTEKTNYNNDISSRDESTEITISSSSNSPGSIISEPRGFRLCSLIKALFPCFW